MASAFLNNTPIVAMMIPQVLRCAERAQESTGQIQAIVSSWPPALKAPRAEALGFSGDSGIDEVVAAFIEDDLPLQKQLAV